MSGTKSDIETIEADLKYLGQRLIIRAFDPVRNKKALRIRSLRRIAEQAFPDDWQRDRVLALELTLKCAITRLDGRLGSISMQEAALRLFNLDGSPPFPDIRKLTPEDIDALKKPTEHRYDYLRRKVIERARLRDSDSSVRKKIADIRSNLAKILADPDFPFMSVAAVRVLHESGVQADSSKYIRRHELHREIRALLDEGEKIIFLEGPAGVGKSRLAWEFAIEHVDSNQVSTLWVSHVDISTSAIKQAITDDEASSFVILEDLSEGSVLSRGLPEVIGPVIIVTTRRSTSIGRGSVVRVNALTLSEATRLVQSRTGVSDGHEARSLAKALGRNPRAIAQACDILNHNQELTMQELRQALHNYAARVLDALTDSDRAPLPALYREIYSNLTRFHPTAAELLENVAFAFAEEDHVPPEFMEACLLRSSQLAANHPTMARVMFKNACRTLANWHLIELAPGCLHINKLTQDILRDLLRDTANVVCNRLLGGIDHWVPVLNEQGAQEIELRSGVPFIEELVRLGIRKKIYAQRSWVNLVGRSLTSDPRYSRALDELEPERLQLIEDESRYTLRYASWLVETDYGTINRDGL